MSIGKPFDLTKCRRFFKAPATSRQRQYEALRAYFVEEEASAEVARRFGYSPGGFRVLCHASRRGELPDFFATTSPGPREQPKKSKVREQARQIFRDLIDMPAQVTITDQEVKVRFYRRAHLPIVLASGLFDNAVPVPWWSGRRLRLIE